jgi:hypothetical protein
MTNRQEFIKNNNNKNSVVVVAVVVVVVVVVSAAAPAANTDATGIASENSASITICFPQTTFQLTLGYWYYLHIFYKIKPVIFNFYIYNKCLIRKA